MLKAIEAAFLAIAAYYKFKLKTADADQQQKLWDLEDEVAALERTGNPADALRAARLQQRLFASRGVLADTLPAPAPEPASGDAGDNR